MRRKILAVASIMILGLVAGAIWVAEASANSKTNIPYTQDSDKLSHYFNISRDALANGENHLVAVYLHKAAIILEWNQAYTGVEGRREYFRAARELNDLSVRVDRMERMGSVTEQEIRSAFTDAHLAIAGDHRGKAIESMENGDARQAASELRLSANHLEKAIWVLGEDVGGTAIRDAREAANRLEAGASWTEAKFSDAVESLGNEIESAGTRL